MHMHSNHPTGLLALGLFALLMAGAAHPTPVRAGTIKPAAWRPHPAQPSQAPVFAGSDQAFQKTMRTLRRGAKRHLSVPTPETAAPEPSQTVTFGLGALCLGALVFKARRRKTTG